MFGLMVLAVLTHAKSLQYQLVNFDDGRYVKKNTRVQHVTLEHVLDILNPKLTRSDPFPEFQPVRDFSFMLDFVLWGEKYERFHIQNIVFHALNVALLFVLLWVWKLPLGVSFLTSALLAVHPMHVESVAWVTSRKDVLGLFFLLLTLLFGSLTENRKNKTFALLFYVLGLFSKSQVLLAPFILMLHAGLFLSMGIKESFQNLFKHYKSMVLICLLYTFWFLFFLQFKEQSISQLYAGGFEPNPLAIVRTFGQYLFHLFFPLSLLPFYTMDPAFKVLNLKFFLSLGALGLMAGIALKVKNETPQVLKLFAIYGLQLIPVLNFLPHPIWVADRYMYFAAPFMFAGVLILIDRFVSWERFKKSAAAILIGVFILITQKQITLWENGVTLWRSVVKAYPEDYRARIFLASVLMDEEKKVDEVLNILLPLKEAYSWDRMVQAALGQAYFILKQYDQAFFWFQKATLQKKTYGLDWLNLGQTLELQGKIPEAIVAYRTCEQTFEARIECSERQGVLLANQGNLTAAQEKFEKAKAGFSKSANTYFNLGLCYVKQQHWDKAEAEFLSALAIDPKHSGALQALALLRKTKP